MKKLAAALCALIALVSVLSFAACGTEEAKYGEWKVTKEPTCTEKGEKRRECLSGCEEDDVEEIPALGHDWDSELSYDIENGKVYSYRVCKRCGDKKDKTEVKDATAAEPSDLAEKLSALQENGALYLAKGTYAANLTLDKKGVKVIGVDGDACVLTGSIAVTADDVTLQNLSVRHTYAPKAEGELVAAETYLFDVSGKNFAMKNCAVSRTDGIAPPYGFLVRLTAQEGKVTFTGCEFLAPVAGDADHIHSISPSVIGGDSVSLELADCTIATNGYGIFNRFATATYKNVTFEGIEGVKDLPANVTVKTLYMAINSAGMKDVTLEGCTVKDCRSWGMLAAGEKLTVKDCKFENCASRMIGIAYGKMGEISVTGCTFDLSKSGYGIKFDESTLESGAKVTITGNTFRGGDTAAKEDGYCISNLNEDFTVTASGNTFENCSKKSAGSVEIK